MYGKGFLGNMTGNLQADGVQSRQTLFVRYCLRTIKNTGYRIDRIQYPVFLCPQHLVQHHKLLFLGSQTNFISCL